MKKILHSMRKLIPLYGVCLDQDKTPRKECNIETDNWVQVNSFVLVENEFPR